MFRNQKSARPTILHGIIKSTNIKFEHHENYIVRKVCRATDRLIQEKVSSSLHARQGTSYKFVSYQIPNNYSMYVKISSGFHYLLKFHS